MEGSLDKLKRGTHAQKRESAIFFMLMCSFLFQTLLYLLISDSLLFLFFDSHFLKQRISETEWFVGPPQLRFFLFGFLCLYCREVLHSLLSCVNLRGAMDYSLDFQAREAISCHFQPLNLSKWRLLFY